MRRDRIVVLDFGSQYAHLIAKRFRMLGYYSEIELPSAPLSAFSDARGVVFSGGPASVYDEDTPEFNREILSLDIPVLGLCYGHYIVNIGYGGKVGRAETGEFGFAELSTDGFAACPLFDGISSPQQVWMSHQDAVLSPGGGFETVGSTRDCRYAALQNLSEKRFSLQFHCEVNDTPCGNQIFANFARFCGMERNWDQDKVLDSVLEGIRRQAGDRNALLFLSGGVDSTVTFALLNRALGQDRVLGLHIDNGFMRRNESAAVAAQYRKFGFQNFIAVDAGESFLKAVEGLVDPQEKRAAVGETFVRVRDQVAAEQKLEEGRWLLAQGTLYPDVIESGGTKNSRTIKTHHNRVSGIQALIQKGLVIEPIRDLYKDEVRRLGRKLGLSDELVMRHPFPGPGLSINVLCSDGVLSGQDRRDYEKAQAEIAALSLCGIARSAAGAGGGGSVRGDSDCGGDVRGGAALSAAAAETAAAGKEAALVAAETAGGDAAAAAAMPPAPPEIAEKYVLPVRSVGVQGDFRTYRFPAVLSLAEKGGGFYELPSDWDAVEKLSSHITNSAATVNRTVLRLYQRPGAALALRKGYCDRLRLDQLREADAIVLDALHGSGWYGKIFQHLTISLPFASAAGRASFVLRPVCSEDVMTARFARLPAELLETVVRQIAALPFTDAVYFDATNKPPATFGWE